MCRNCYEELYENDQELPLRTALFALKVTPDIEWEYGDYRVENMADVMATWKNLIQHNHQVVPICVIDPETHTIDTWQEHLYDLARDDYADSFETKDEIIERLKKANEQLNNQVVALKITLNQKGPAYQPRY